MAYREGQSFGYELEVYDGAGNRPRTSWVRQAEELRQGVARATGDDRVASRVVDRYRVANYDRWGVARDASVGFEVVSRVLTGSDGLEELVKASIGIEGVIARSDALRINHLAGAHLNIAWAPQSAEQVRRLVLLTHALEPALATIVAPSRIARYRRSRYDVSRPNAYCEPISAHLDWDMLMRARTVRSAVAAQASRRSTVNLAHLKAKVNQRVEIRLHNGTTDPNKLVWWLALWMRILWVAEDESRALPPTRHDRREVIVPNGDIVAMTARYLALPGVRTPLLTRLSERRRAIGRIWAQHHDLADWMAYATTWTAADSAAPVHVDTSPHASAVSPEERRRVATTMEMLTFERLKVILRDCDVAVCRTKAETIAMASSMLPFSELVASCRVRDLKRILQKSGVSPIPYRKPELRMLAMTHVPGWTHLGLRPLSVDGSDLRIALRRVLQKRTAHHIHSLYGGTTAGRATKAEVIARLLVSPVRSATQTLNPADRRELCQALSLPSRFGTEATLAMLNYVVATSIPHRRSQGHLPLAGQP